ncbi:MAG: glycosyltransferase family 39 protein [Isosphaeraceae bacterium]|nr:glycosyltransferase family 39 protein [Isosphaeraceae bacterium]
MPDRLGIGRWIALFGLAALTLLIGLGGPSAPRLSYHEALVAQGAREMWARGDLITPTIAGLPWIEKPPLAHWLTLAGSRLAGRVDEWTTRLPSALAAVVVVVAVALLAARHHGGHVGLIAGLVQATTYWTVQRGRLGDADIQLTAIITAALVVFDALRSLGSERSYRTRALVVLFFTLLGMSAWAKGIVFGSVIIGVVVCSTLLAERDWATARRLLSPSGWAWTALLTLAWPAAVIATHPQALGLWTLHISDRLAERSANFAGGPWWSYLAAMLGLVLPWTPFAWVSILRAFRSGPRRADSFDRFLAIWAFAPLVLLSFATVKNAHYAIHALPPFSIWAARSVARLLERLEAAKWSPRALRIAGVGSFAILGTIYAVMNCLIIPRYESRGSEVRFLERIGPGLPAASTLVLLHDDWDRLPYRTPFGPVPHDLALRLFALDRPDVEVRTVFTPASLESSVGDLSTFTVLARSRDLPALDALGTTTLVFPGPTDRWDRTFDLYRVSRSTRPALRELREDREISLPCDRDGVEAGRTW